MSQGFRCSVQFRPKSIRAQTLGNCIQKTQSRWDKDLQKNRILAIRVITSGHISAADIYISVDMDVHIEADMDVHINADMFDIFIKIRNSEKKTNRITKLLNF